MASRVAWLVCGLPSAPNVAEVAIAENSDSQRYDVENGPSLSTTNTVNQNAWNKLWPDLEGFQECDEEDVEIWMACDAEPCGFQMRQNDEFVTYVQEESDSVDDEAEDNTTNKISKDPSNADAFSSLETAMEWCPVPIDSDKRRSTIIFPTAVNNMLREIFHNGRNNGYPVIRRRLPSIAVATSVIASSKRSLRLLPGRITSDCSSEHLKHSF
ncbi:hypothetical protein TNCV_116571 [Trichonephila clavipes]|nr:hypothetical protein TNCV_116571 [Trichonephila clavipes]